MLHAELLKVQAWVKEEQKRIIGFFEGRDAAGKGGTIKRFMEHLNSRSAHQLHAPLFIQPGLSDKRPSNCVQTG